MSKKIDLFPAIVLFAPPDSVDPIIDLTISSPRPQGTRRVDRSRVAIFDGKIFVAQDSPEGPKLVFREKIAFYTPSEDGKTHHVLTESGKILAFAKDNDCGCGSRLRSWSPFGAHLDSSKDPDV